MQRKWNIYSVAKVDNSVDTSPSMSKSMSAAFYFKHIKGGYTSCKRRHWRGLVETRPDIGA